MKEQSKRMLRGGARAVTGVSIIGVSIGVALVLGTGIAPVPTVDRGVVSLDVDTNQNARFSLVCAGAFAELGADPSQPSHAVPSGETQLVITGNALETGQLTREQEAGTAPAVIQSSVNSAVAAAELQQVLTPTLQGLAASSCVEPAHEQWLVGGATGLGQSATLILGNPHLVPATVEVALYDGEGRVDAAQTAGVLVPAGSQRIVSINGYAPGRERLAIRVESTGAAVSAALGVSQTVDIRSYAVDTVTRQVAPQTQLVFPAVTNVNEHERVVEDREDFPVVVRILAPGGEESVATVRALLPNGAVEELGTLELVPGAVTDFEIPIWNERAQAILVESEVPVVGGVFGSADIAPSHDYTWFAPAPMLPASTDVAVSVVADGELVIANPGDVDATVTLTAVEAAGAAGEEAGSAEAEGAAEDADTAEATGEAAETAPADEASEPVEAAPAEAELIEAEPADEAGEASTVTVPAGAATVVPARGEMRLTSTEPVAAGVRVIMGSFIAGYPVQAPPELGTTLRVYTR